MLMISYEAQRQEGAIYNLKSSVRPLARRTERLCYFSSLLPNSHGPTRQLLHMVLPLFPYQCWWTVESRAIERKGKKCWMRNAHCVLYSSSFNISPRLSPNQEHMRGRASWYPKLVNLYWHEFKNSFFPQTKPSIESGVWYKKFWLPRFPQPNKNWALHL